MSLTTLIYFWGIADNAKGAFIACFCIFTFIAFLLLLITFNNTVLAWNEKPFSEGWVKTKKWVIWSFIISIIFGISSVFIPDSKTIAAMYIIPKVVENKHIQQLPDNFAKVANDAMYSISKKLERGS